MSAKNKFSVGRDEIGLQRFYELLEGLVLQEEHAMDAFAIVLETPKPPSLGKHEATLARVTLLTAMCLLTQEFVDIAKENAVELAGKLQQKAKERSEKKVIQLPRGN